jgi:hypothetical protein
MLLDLPPDHLGIRDDEPCAVLTEKLALNREQFAVFPGEPTQPTFPRRLKLRPPPEPGSVDSIARPIRVALPNPLQAEEKITAPTWFRGCQGIGESARRFPT